MAPTQTNATRQLPQGPTVHGRTTRVLHIGLALVIIGQLTSSLWMEPPAPDEAGNQIFQIHQYLGLTGFAVIFLFWITVAFRRRGTDAGLLLPWFSARRRAALLADLGAHLRALRAMQYPAHADHSPLAAAIHGLGLLLMTAMASSGALYYLINQGDPDAGGLVGVTMLVHTGLANLVWAYLIGHASVAVLNHATSHQSLRAMWSLQRDPSQEN